MKTSLFTAILILLAHSAVAAYVPYTPYSTVPSTTDRREEIRVRQMEEQRQENERQRREAMQERRQYIPVGPNPDNRPRIWR